MNRAIAAAATLTVPLSIFVLAVLLFGASASAQTASPTPTGTARATSVASGTAATTATPGGQPTFAPTVVVPGSIYKPGGGDFPFAHPGFESVWNRTDSLAKSRQARRTC